MEISIKCFIYFQLLSSVCLSLSHGCPQWPCRGSWGQFEPWLGTAVLPWITHSVFCLQQGQEQQLSHRGSFCFWTVTTEHSHSKGSVYFKRRLNLQNVNLIIQLLMTNEFLCVADFSFNLLVCLSRKILNSLNLMWASSKSVFRRTVMFRNTYTIGEKYGIIKVFVKF